MNNLPTFEDLRLEIRDEIAFLTVHRPEKLNALRRHTMHELDLVFDFLQKEQAAFKVVIVTGSGNKAFVAGADISEFSSLDAAAAKEVSAEGNRIFAKIENFTRPVIMAVNGYALGGGLELAMAGHIRVAADNAVLGLPEVSLGIFPGYGGTQRLPLLVGPSKAMELIFTAERISAEEALRIGLVGQVVSQDLLMTTCLGMAEKIKKNSAKAISLSIAAILAAHKNSFSEEIAQFEKCFQGDNSDFLARVQHFLKAKK